MSDDFGAIHIQMGGYIYVRRPSGIRRINPSGEKIYQRIECWYIKTLFHTNQYLGAVLRTEEGVVIEIYDTSKTYLEVVLTQHIAEFDTGLDYIPHFDGGVVCGTTMIQYDPASKSLVESTWTRPEWCGSVPIEYKGLATQAGCIAFRDTLAILCLGNGTVAVNIEDTQVSVECVTNEQIVINTFCNEGLRFCD